MRCWRVAAGASRPATEPAPAVNAARRFLVSGHVQGVFFRASTAREAERLGLRGHAKNLADGRVEVLALGPSPALDELERWLGDGPPRARVDEVRVEQAQPAAFAGLTDFRTA
ncbi:MAG: acylphosphatase [Chromatiales bacterium]|nr:acylphosphatase [Chromatiales bacterium]